MTTRMPTPPPPAPLAVVRSSRPLVFLMVLAVAAVTALAFWDHRRESAAALEDFAVDQATLAGSVVAELHTRLAVVQRDALLIAESLEEGRRVPAAAREGYSSFGWHGDVHRSSGDRGIVLGVQAGSGRTLDLLVSPIRLLEGASRVERPGAVRLLLQAPEDGRLHGTDGSLVDCPLVQAALAADRPSVWLGRAEASALGLPPRLAAAGLASIDAGPLGRWGVVVVTTAERVRDRERRALYRLALGVGLAAGLVFAFGTAALRRQRQGLLLERRLALAALARERDAELATANRAATLGTLAMGIAHEVSTPLGIITGRGEQLLSRLDGDERGARSVRAILDQAERIRRVIRAFLDVVRGDARTLGDTAPRAVLEGATALVEHRFAAVGVHLDCAADPDLPAIHGDAPLLQQAMVNLLLNACDACAPGGHVEARVARGGDGGVVFTVTDDGRGISKEEAVRATEPFFTTKPPGQGSGLGLAITSEIVKLHRGKLALEPASPRGTRASLTVPVPEERAHAAA